MLEVRSLQVLARWQLQDRPYGIDVTRDGRHVLVATPGNLLMLDAETGAVGQKVAVGPDARVVRLSPDGTRAYVTNSTYPSSLSVIDLAAMEEIKKIRMGEGAEGLGATPDGQWVYGAHGLA